MAKPTVQPGAEASCAEAPCPDAPCPESSGVCVPDAEAEPAQPVKTKKSNRPWRPVFLAVLAETSNVTAAAAAAEIPASRAYKDKRDDSEFAARWREALCEGYDLLEIEVLYRLALRRAEGRGEVRQRYRAAPAFAASRDRGARTGDP